MISTDKYDKDFLVSLLKQMLLVRRFEEKAGQMYGLKKIGGFCHLAIGQEALNIGVCEAMQKGKDKLLTGYRDHGYALGLGMDPNHVMAELYGKATGCSRGKGGSMHLFDYQKGMWGGNGIVAAQIPIAVGVAYAEKFKVSPGVILCLFGDGAIHQGAFHEALNLAKIWQTPILFICENNKYGMGTEFHRVSSQPQLWKLGEAYNIQSKQIDALEVLNVYEHISKALKYCRDNNEPLFIEAITYRYRGHSMSDPATYRSKEELESYKKKDCIDQLRDEMIKNNLLDPSAWQEIEKEIKRQVEASVEFAENSPYPNLEEIYSDVWV